MDYYTHVYPNFLKNDVFGLTLISSCQEKKPDPQIVDVEKHIRRLEKFIRNNGNRNVGKQELCKIIGISRPSLDKWTDDELISKGKTKEVYAGNPLLT